MKDKLSASQAAGPASGATTVANFFKPKKEYPTLVNTAATKKEWVEAVDNITPQRQSIASNQSQSAASQKSLPESEKHGPEEASKKHARTERTMEFPEVSYGQP